jgi:hypothetical protein
VDNTEAFVLDSFRWITVAISMILGIGVTRLLSSAVVIVRNRDDFRLDFLPIAWAIYVFFAQIQFWWGIIELSKLKSVWSLTDFLTFLSMPLLLFIAAALVLPHEARAKDLDLREGFERDGRLALIALTVFNAVALVVDASWWSANLLTMQGAMLLGLVLLPPAVLLISSRRIQIVVTVVYAVLLIACDIDASPSAYG